MGKRQHPNGSNDPNNSLFGINTDRGFTGHEHLDEVVLIHMNGRIQKTIVFSPTTGDPLVFIGKCAGARGDYTTQINKMPKNFGEPIDFGEVMLKSLDRQN